jgi:hypothetical protein
MPTEFLSDDQLAPYGRFSGAPSRTHLERYFFLDDADRALIARHRRPHLQLGFALQLGTVRYLGTFLPDPLDLPTNRMKQPGLPSLPRVRRMKRESIAPPSAKASEQCHGMCPDWLHIIWPGLQQSP